MYVEAGWNVLIERVRDVVEADRSRDDQTIRSRSENGNWIAGIIAEAEVTKGRLCQVLEKHRCRG